MSQMMSSDYQEQANDVLRIREIIFGAQMREYEQRFRRHEERMQDLQNQINTLAAQTEAQFQQWQAETQRQFDELRAEMQRRFEALEAQLIAHVERLRYEKTTRFDLGDMLIELGERLKRDGS